MTDRPAVDPRFDPAFQPGYNGPSPAPLAWSDPRPVDAPELRPRRRATEGLATPEAEQPVRGATEPPTSVQHPDADAGEADDEDRPRRNPYLVALWVAGAVLTILPLWVAYSAYQAQANPQGIQDQTSWLLYAFMMQLAPPVLFVGLAALAGALALSAARWRR